MRISGCNSQVQDASSNTPVAKASARTVKDTSSLMLKLRTAEGDTVEISIEAQSLRRSERASARGNDGRVSQKRDSNSNNLTASVNVTGDLSDAEIKDIQSLLQSLGNGDTPQAGQGELDTVSAYQYSYQHTHEVSQSTAQLYG